MKTRTPINDHMLYTEAENCIGSCLLGLDCSESIPDAPDTGYGGELGTRMGPDTLGPGTPVHA